MSAVKDIFEDAKRHKSDNQENNSEAEILNLETKKFEKRAWRNIKVGNIIRVTNERFFPADIVMLSSSGHKGLAYVETKSLDGETNLKHKVCNQEVLAVTMTENELSKVKGTIECEPPNEHIYEFKGNMESKQFGQKISIDKDNFLLRGSSLRNTDWVTGIVVFTGHDTKIMMNSASARAKKSRIEVLTNKMIFSVFIIQLILCLFGGVYGTTWLSIYKVETSSYLSYDTETSVWKTSWPLNALQRFGTWILIFT